MAPERSTLTAAQRALILANLDLITWAAKRGPGSFAGRMDREEVHSLATIILVECAHNWDGKGEFRRIARKSIRHAVIDHCRHVYLLDRGTVGCGIARTCKTANSRLSARKKSGRKLCLAAMFLTSRSYSSKSEP